MIMAALRAKCAPHSTSIRHAQEQRDLRTAKLTSTHHGG
jgi:hypothetical protein